MSADDRLTVGEVAALIGVATSTFRAYVARGQAPPPDGHLDGRTPYWLRSTIKSWRS